jgi:DNA (cytosine-5)-methyltransferase 1
MNASPRGGGKLRVLDLFSGIGGFSLGLERTGGFETVAFCEIEPFPRRVLAKHWPGVPCYEDVRTLTRGVLERDGITGINVITGGFPCQDLSNAGNRAGMGAGTRSGLWSEIVRLVGELRPEYVIVENVAALLSGPSKRRGGWFGRVLGDLAECGYDAEWENIPAAAMGAPHRRDRVWIVSFPAQDRNHEQRFSSSGTRDAQSQGARITVQLYTMDRGWKANVSNANSIDGERQQPRSSHAQGREGQVARSVGSFHSTAGGQWEIEPAVGRVAHGVPNRMDRLAALGNSVVPQIPEMIGRAILASRHHEAMK